jgi:hypothetical protein
MHIEKVIANHFGHYMVVRCDCGAEIKHYLNKWRVECPKCNTSMPVSELGSSEPKEDE